MPNSLRNIYVLISISKKNTQTLGFLAHHEFHRLNHPESTLRILHDKHQRFSHFMVEPRKSRERERVSRYADVWIPTVRDRSAVQRSVHGQVMDPQHRGRARSGLSGRAVGLGRAHDRSDSEVCESMPGSKNRG